MLIQFPQLPVSAMITADKKEVFLTMHFETRNIHEAKELSAALADWLTAFLTENGALDISDDGGEYHE